jgi:uncharacterized protein YqjF (DUF2071 family)
MVNTSTTRAAVTSVGARLTSRFAGESRSSRTSRSVSSQRAFRLYTVLLGRIAVAQVQHPPWPLESATVLGIEQDVIQHSGLPAQDGEPLVRLSPGVYVRIGRPMFLDELKLRELSTVEIVLLRASG